MVVWESDTYLLGGPTGDRRGIFGQRFDSTGTALGTEFQVNSYTSTTTFNPDVAADADGDFVVVWTSYPQDGDLDRRLCAALCQRRRGAGTEFQVNTYTAGFQSDTFFFFGGGPAVSSDAAGDFVVVWDNALDYGVASTIAGQRFDSGGGRLGTEFEAASYTSQYNLEPDVASTSGGDFVIVWGRIAYTS